jgi:hypothetical protein
MANGEVIRTGFLMGERVPRPKKAPGDFEWPNPRAVDEATKLKFRARLTEELLARGMNHKDLAILAHGEVRRKNGHVVPRMPAAARNWVFGKSFPTAGAANGLAGYFKISTADLLKPKGELQAMPLLRMTAKQKKAHAKTGNGHDHGAAAVAKKPKKKATGVVRVTEVPPPPLPLPEGATPALVKLESFAGDPRFMTVNITGTLPVDRALALVAMIHPEHR